MNADQTSIADKTSVADQAKALQPELVAWRRALHACPELKMDTPQTADLILQALRAIGISEIRAGIGGGSGIAAVIRGGRPGRTLGIRADCDGLPLQEETGLPFASTNGAMHACGHDAHTAMALGAARILQENRDRLCGDVKMIFQPGEEFGIGARLMTADGVLEQPPVDAIIGLHTGTLFPGFKPGEIGYLSDRFGFYITTFQATFHGQGGHSSTPHLSRDAILMACYAVTQVQAVTSREKNPLKPATISIGTIQGGQKNNIIADTCSVTGTIRSDNREDQAFYTSRVEAIFRSVAEGLRGSLDFRLPMRLRSTPIDPALLAIFLKSAAKVLPQSAIRPITEVNPVGEDFSEYCDRIPGFIFFHCSAFGDERDYPHHHPKFTVNEETLWSGSALLAQFALDWQA